VKKNLVVGLVLAFVMVFSFGVLAENSDDTIWASAEYLQEYGYDGNDGNYDRFGDDGLVWFNDADSNNPGMYTLLELNRNTPEGYTFDRNRGTNDNDQMLEIELPTYAYIPCYLEITLTGNQGTTSGKSFGPGAAGTKQATGYMMVFDNEIGGFVDDDWMSLGAGQNAEVAPGEDVFIAGCDIFKVETYGNEAYKYYVQSSPLVTTDNGGAVLPMHIRTSFSLGDAWERDFDTIGAPNTVVLMGTQVAGEALTALHNFRVPYGIGVVHGSYSGSVIFRVVSI
jgi:hypothetical protein